MYLPAHFSHSKEQDLFRLIQQLGVGSLITQGEKGITANQVPLLLDENRRCLIGHLAAPNSQLEDLASGGEVLVNFLGQSAYISPNWYADRGMVPTWNFVSVQVRGHAQILRDSADLRDIVERLSEKHEENFPQPWTLEKMDPQQLEKMLSVIVGFAIEITDIQGKYKLSQNKNPDDRRRVVAGLRERGDVQSLQLASMMEDFFDRN